MSGKSIKVENNTPFQFLVVFSWEVYKTGRWIFVGTSCESEARKKTLLSSPLDEIMFRL